MIEKIQNYYEESTLGKVIVLSSIIVPCLGLFYVIFGSQLNSENKAKVVDESSLVIYEKDSTFNNSRDGYYKKEEERKKIEKSAGFFSYSESVQKVRENINSNDQVDSIYQEAEDPRFKAMEEQIKNMSGNSRQMQSNSAPLYTNREPVKTFSATKKEEKKPKKKELTYEERLELAKKKRLETVTNYGYGSVSNNDISFQAIVFEDQWKLPGQRLKLMLPKETVINGKKFKRATPIYAMVDIRESRIYLDINNIDGVHMNLQAYDPDDRRSGMYSQRAGELWKEYQNSLKEDTENEIADEITDNVDLPLVGSAVSGIANFFRSKRIKDQDKLIYLNNHIVLIQNTKK